MVIMLLQLAILFSFPDRNKHVHNFHTCSLSDPWMKLEHLNIKSHTNERTWERSNMHKWVHETLVQRGKMIQITFLQMDSSQEPIQEAIEYLRLNETYNS